MGILWEVVQTGLMWRGRPGLASRLHLAGGKEQGQDALATWPTRSRTGFRHSKTSFN